MGMFTCLIFSIVLTGFGYVQAEECPSRMNCALRLSCGARPSIASVYNVETEMGVLIDTENDLSLLFDGTTGKQLFYDHKKLIGYESTGQMESWNVTQSTIEEYVESIGSLKNVYKSFRKQLKFKIKTAPDEVISTHRIIIQTLEPEMTDFREYKNTDILSISINLFQELCRLKKQKLRKLFEKKLKLKKYFINGGLINVISAFRGISSMIKEIRGSIEKSILSADFDLQPIFSAECGTESLATFADQFNDREMVEWENIQYSLLYNIVREFDGGVYKGLRGIEAVIYHLIQFSQNRISLEVLIDVLIQVTASIKEATYPMIIEKVKYIQKILSTKLSSSVFHRLEVYFNDFLEDKLIINNINICDILKQYLTGTSFGLPNVVKILHTMKSNFYSALSVLFNRMSFFIMTGQAPLYILKLIPNLNSSLDLQDGVPPILQITESLKPQIFMELGEENFEDTMSTIPVLGDMFSEITEMLPMIKEKKELWIKEITKDVSFSHLSGWIKFGMGLQGGEKPMGCVHEMGLWGLDRSECACWD